MEALLLSVLVKIVIQILTLIAHLRLLAPFFPKSAIVKDNDCYDYIVIGGGSAGSVLGNRLTEDPDLNVLVVEAGDIPSIQSAFPGLFPFLQNSYEDWQFKSQSEWATASQSDDIFKLAAGKVLGGSANIDHLVYLPGAKEDYNNWAKITGYQQWNYENVLPYFKKAENLNDKNILEEYGEYHGTDGPLCISRETHEEGNRIIEAFAEVGNNASIDLNLEYPLGYAQPTFSICKGIRQGVAFAYLPAVKDRSNFNILYNSIAVKINIENNVAVSVDIETGGKVITVRASKEIIVSAGVYSTPKLFMLSGIGPREHLESLGIEVKKDLPVGKNLQDHVGVQSVIKLEKTLKLPPLLLPTRVGLPIVIGAKSLDETKTRPTYQTTNIFLSPHFPIDLILSTEIFGYKKHTAQKVHDQCVGDGRNCVFSLIAIVQPQSKGEVMLKSNNYKDDLIIKMNFYNDTKDLDNMVLSIEDYMKVLDSTDFKNVNATLVTLAFDDCDGDFNDRDYIKCYIKNMSATLYHQTSTCPMGTVVDENLKVIGIDRLRVVDASVMPTIPTANPLAAVIMIAEKASDMIKNEKSNFTTSKTCKHSSSRFIVVLKEKLKNGLVLVLFSTFVNLILQLVKLVKTVVVDVLWF